MGRTDAGIYVGVSDDAEEPGGEVGIVAKGVDVFVQPDKNLSGNVGRVVVVARERVSEFIDGLLVSADQRVPCGAISPLAGLDDLPIARWSSVRVLAGGGRHDRSFRFG